MDKYEKAREKIRKIVYDPIYCSDIWYIDGMIDRILSLPDILVKDENQSLPTALHIVPRSVCDTTENKVYKLAQQDMLSNNWVKVIKCFSAVNVNKTLE